jgi:hypothetical protein
MSNSNRYLIIAVWIVTIIVVSIFGISGIETTGNGKLLLGFTIFVISMAVGLIWKMILDIVGGYFEISWTEFIVAGLIIGILFSVLGVNLGWWIAWKSRITFNEFWNGWELEAVTIETECRRDGPCVHEYSCDPYVVLVPYACNCDDDGCSTCWRPEVRYHNCPYATYEYDHIIRTTLGDYVIDRNVFAKEPQAWREGRKRIPTSVQWGPSQFWLDAYNRCEQGTPGPVTVRKDYENLLLGSDETILNEYSDAIDYYLEQELLPDVQREVRDFYNADKVYFVNFQPSDPESWQWRHSLLNAALGSELQGDLHVVVVKDQIVSNNPDRYITALKAYWQDPETWGMDTISKNSIIVVIGTEDGNSVSFARAITGMPMGNEDTLYAVRNQLKGLELKPEVIFGEVQGDFFIDSEGQKDVLSVGETGALRRILWGIDDLETKFDRVSMTAGDEDDTGSGFNYLTVEIKPKAGAQIAIMIITLLLTFGVWAIVAYVTDDEDNLFELFRRS